MTEKRWRAGHGKKYYYLIINHFGEFVIFKAYDFRHSNSQKSYDSGNYFRTKKEAEKYIETIKGLLKNRK